ncbi:MAG: AmmeMemoRadiSam system protein B [Desulfomonile tiedjei]|nr:AmmeMemoRadiSam system protein B [Desulfomonile tiedjei]
MTIRKRALPRGWYPGSAEECNAQIDEFLRGFNSPDGTWRGGIVPHAGWFFSGKASARVMSAIAASGTPDRVVVYGGHLQDGSDPIAYTEDWWDTPLGPQPMDAQLVSGLISSGDVAAAARMFADNTVEIQLPIVRRLFKDIPIVAIHSPGGSGAIRLGETVSRLLEEKGLSAVYIGSADLTHYGPNYGFVPKGVGAEAVRWVKEENDRVLIDHALAMDPESLLREARTRHNTCSAGPIASVIASVARHGVKSGTLLEYYTSYDVIPDSSFVGYAGIVY